ncbi:transposase [Chryseobacterium gambrini]|uniref:Transposase n=1 Tax=Chryseobacterium gambrini TaxID=373672 RepID=A0AAJ1R6Z5_9FLAO|nr:MULTISPECIES: transposase [Chryseobacterium]MDN4013434.1 transposase [Chryseobacterium gambrini]
MNIDFKDIHIGSLVKIRVDEKNIEIMRICKFFQCTEKEVNEMYKAKSIDCEILLKWCKILDYDFFRVYTQHLILFSPQERLNKNKNRKKESLVPQFRKNIYTKELIGFILELLENNEKTQKQIIEDYRIPKTTLHKWISKYNIAGKIEERN